VPVQLPLNIGLSEAATFASFHAAGNAAPIHALQRAAEPFLFLWGSAGSGKSHLLQAACHAAAAQHERSGYLPLALALDAGAEALEGLEDLDLVALDDLHLVAGMPDWELRLFTLYNRVREAGGRLLAAARSAPHALGIEMADLRSRLVWGPVFQLQPLDDEGRLAALQLRARRRGMELPTEVGTFLLRRAPRDLHTLFALLDQLDRASLAAQRRLTIPFVRSVLARQGPQ